MAPSSGGVPPLARSRPAWRWGVCFSSMLLLACGHQATEAQHDPPQIEPKPQVDTVDVRKYGARGDGLADDGPPFAAALQALAKDGGVLWIPQGVYNLSPTASRPARALDLSFRSSVVVAGAGMELTTLRVTPGEYRGDTHLVFMEQSHGITLQDLTLDGNGRASSFSDEQTHCAETWWSSFVRFARVRFYDCNGDGIRLLGKSDGAAWTDSITVVHSSFDANRRSGIAVQRATRRVYIAYNTFRGTSDQDIDFEPTGLDEMQTNLPEDFTIEHNTILHSTRAHSVTLGGRRITFAHNVVNGGALFIPRADSLIIEGNTIVGPEERQPLELDKWVDKAWIVDNEIRDGRTTVHAGSPGTVTIEARARSGLWPQNVYVSRNRIHAVMHGVTVSDAEYVRVVGNAITGNGSGYGIQAPLVLVTGGPRRGLHIEGNEIRDFVIGVRLSTRGDAFSDVRITDNLFEDTQSPPTQTVGIHFRNTGPWASFAFVSANTFGAGIVTPIVVSR